MHLCPEWVHEHSVSRFALRLSSFPFCTGECLPLRKTKYDEWQQQKRKDKLEEQGFIHTLNHGTVPHTLLVFFLADEKGSRYFN